MRRALLNIAFILVIPTLSGCMGEISPVFGRIHTDVYYGAFATAVTDASKRGEACAKSILTLFAFGDATITSAKANAGITQVATIEHASFNVLGIYSKWCTIVKGN